MVNFKVFLMICGVTAVVYGAGDGGVGFVPQPNDGSTTVPPTSSTSTTTTVSPNVTTATTTTPAPTTTTPSTTTTPAPKTTTTAATTTAKPSPTPTPAPVDPKVANWTVNYANSNRSCIILFVAAQFEVLDTNSNLTIKINVPLNATSTGSCEDKETQTLTVSWDQNDSLEFDFGKTNTSKFDLNKITSTLNVSSETGPKVYKLVHENPEFSTPLSNSYKCARTQTLNLTEENSNATIAYLHISHLQYQAFRNSTEHKFDSALDCESSVTPDVVPIVVGCVLAALVVAVLVAYLFGRRRCQARGYLSMFEETRTEADYIPMKNLSCFK